MKRRSFLLPLVVAVAGCETSQSHPTSQAPAPQPAPSLPPFPDAGRQAKVEVPRLTWDSGFIITASVEKFAYLYGSPSLIDFPSLLTQEVDDRNRHKDPLRIQSVRRTETRCRMLVYGARSIVLTGHNYYELVFIDASLTETRVQTLAVASGVPAPPHDTSPDTALNKALRARVSIFDLTVVASGRFKAGGAPSDFTGYTDDMEAKGFSAELDLFLFRLLEIATPRLSEEVQRFDMRSGEARPRRPR